MTAAQTPAALSLTQIGAAATTLAALLDGLDVLAFLALQAGPEDTPADHEIRRARNSLGPLIDVAREQAHGLEAELAMADLRESRRRRELAEILADPENFADGTPPAALRRWAEK